MSDYKKYFLRQLGLNESRLNVDEPQNGAEDLDQGFGSPSPEASTMPSFQKMLSPTAIATPVIGMAVRGSSTGGFPSGRDQTGIASNTPTGRLGGYEPIPIAHDNSKIVDKTPKNSSISSGNPISNVGPTPENPHAHQVQQATGQPPQSVTGASTDSDTNVSNGQPDSNQQSIDIDVEEDPANMLHEGKHKSGCKCAFCANKGSFGKKGKKDEKKDKTDKKDSDDSNKSSDKKDSKSKGNPFAKKNTDKDDSDKDEDSKDTKKTKMDETFEKHMGLMQSKLGLTECDECGCDSCEKPVDKDKKMTTERLQTIKKSLTEKAIAGKMNKSETKLFNMLQEALKLRK